MNIENMIQRVDALLAQDAAGSFTTEGREMMAGTLSILTLIYGAESRQVKQFVAEIDQIRAEEKYHIAAYGSRLSASHLRLVKSELEAGLIGDFSRTISGDVLADFLKLSREALEEKGDGAKNVAAVLAAALYEDTIRRLATTNSLTNHEKLADVITELKTAGILTGSAIGIAQGYLNFRNNALHADFDKVDRPETKSILGFTEGLLLKHFS